MNAPEQVKGTDYQLSDQQKQELISAGRFKGNDGCYYQPHHNPNVSTYHAIKHHKQEDADRNDDDTRIVVTLSAAYAQLPDHLRQQVNDRPGTGQAEENNQVYESESETAVTNRPAMFYMTDEELAELPDFEAEEAKTGAVEMQQLDQQSAGTDRIKSGDDYAGMLAAARVRPTDKIPTPPICLTIEQDGGQTVIGTMGNISAIIGKPKSKKTFAATFAVAAAVDCKPKLNRVNGSLPDGQRTVILFDTEQSKYHVLRVVKRICALVGVEEPPNLIVYSLREYPPGKRLTLIDYALNHTAGLGMAVIDGIRDLQVDPILDAEQASKIITHLLRWTTELNIHIMTVLHQNKSDGNARGHLGTELTNKAETVISVTRDRDNKEISIVAPEFCRGRDFKQFPFSVDDNGLPFLVEDWLPKTTAGRVSDAKTDNPSKIPVTNRFTIDRHQAIVKQMFSGVKPDKYTVTWQRLKRATAYFGDAIADNPAKELLTYYQDQGYVSQDNNKCYILSLQVENDTPNTEDFTQSHYAEKSV